MAYTNLDIMPPTLEVLMQKFVKQNSVDDATACARINALNEGLKIAGFLSGGTPNPPDKKGSKTLH